MLTGQEAQLCDCSGFEIRPGPNSALPVIALWLVTNNLMSVSPSFPFLCKNGDNYLNKCWWMWRAGLHPCCTDALRSPRSRSGHVRSGCGCGGSRQQKEPWSGALVSGVGSPAGNSRRKTLVCLEPLGILPGGGRAWLAWGPWVIWAGVQGQRSLRPSSTFSTQEDSTNIIPQSHSLPLSTHAG